MSKIIIDKVNVEGCIGLNQELPPLMKCTLLQFETEGGDIAGYWCSDHSNCYYKQLQRLKQENEKLQARLRPLEDSYFNGLSPIEIAGLAKKSIRITSENRKLETALEEIREIASFKCKSCDKKCNSCEKFVEIEAKINEVLK